MKTSKRAVQTKYNKSSDEELLYIYLNHRDNMAMMCLFERYGHIVFGILLKRLKTIAAAKQATQELFIKLSDDLAMFQIEQFKPRLFSMAENYNNGNISVVPMPDNVPYDRADGLIDINKKELVDRITDAMSGLDTEHRAALELFYIKKMCFKEIAAKTGKTLNEVKELIMKGKENINTLITTLR